MTRKARGRLPRHIQRALQPSPPPAEPLEPLPHTIPATQPPPAVVRPPTALVLASGGPSLGRSFGPPSPSATSSETGLVLAQPRRPTSEVLTTIGATTLIGEASEGGQEFWITLKQEILGGLQIRISIQGKEVSAVLLAPSPAIKYLLKQRLPELKDHLKARGFRVTRMDIEVQPAPEE